MKAQNAKLPRGKKWAHGSADYYQDLYEQMRRRRKAVFMKKNKAES